jgi:hypothetical protein
MTTSRSLGRRGAFTAVFMVALVVVALIAPTVAIAESSPSGSESFYDRNGRFDRTAIRNSDGATSFYDRAGRFTGSSVNTTSRR